MKSQESNDLLLKLFDECHAVAASDLHVGSDEPCFVRVAGQIRPVERVVSQDQVKQLVVRLAGENAHDLLAQKGSIDGAIGLPGEGEGLHRFRYNIYQTAGTISIAFRRLESDFRTLEELGLPKHLYDVTNSKDGLVLVAGPTGSGKSTTLATLIDHINQNRNAHIVTIEDPVEYIHESSKARITQRQVGLDTPSFGQAVYDAVRQDPDVLLVGELRDLETISNAIEVALTGHLVFATVHAGDTVGAIERLVNVFPGDQQPLIQQMLSSSLRAIVAQHLLPGQDPPGSRVLASELLYRNTAISNLIRNADVNQIRSVLETGASEGMYTLDSSLAKLVHSRKIAPATARSLARNPKFLADLSRAI